MAILKEATDISHHAVGVRAALGACHVPKAPVSQHKQVPFESHPLGNGNGAALAACSCILEGSCPAFTDARAEQVL